MDTETYSDAVEAATKVVEGLDLPDDLRVAAFSEVLRHALGVGTHSTDTNVQHSAPLVPQDTRLERFEAEYVGTISEVQRIAKHLHLTDATANAVFRIVDERPQLGIASDRLPRSKSGTMQEIALVLCAAREALGLVPTSTGDVREECILYGKYDGPNFAASLKAMPQWLIVKGAPRAKDKELILLVPGREEAARIIQRWAGEDRGT